MANKPLFTELFLKKLIVEIRHPGSLIHFQEAEKKLNELTDHFDNVSVTNEANIDKTIQFTKEKSFFRMFSKWDRYGFTVENSRDLRPAEELIELYFAPINKNFGIKNYNRFGVRGVFLLPFLGTFNELVEICRNRFYNNSIMNGLFEQVTDIGTWIIEAEEGKFKIKVNVGPVKHEEIVTNSEFKKFDESTENALLADIDVFQEGRDVIGNVMTKIRNAYAIGNTKARNIFDRMQKENSNV